MMLRKIMKCWFDAIDYYENHQQEAAEIMAKRLDTSPEDFIATMDKLQNAFRRRNGCHADFR